MWPLKVEEDQPGRPATLIVPAGYYLHQLWIDSSGRLVVRFWCHDPLPPSTVEESTSAITLPTPPPLSLPETETPDVQGPDFSIFGDYI